MAIKHFHKTDKVVFMDEEAIVSALTEMEADTLLNTSPILVRDGDGFTWHVDFQERHLTYLRTHPKVDPEKYLANVKTMIRIRR